MTLAQIAENPMTVTTDEAISSFADSRQRRLAVFLRHPKDIRSLPIPLVAPSIIAACLSCDNGSLMS
jgi:hypothetical protein